LAELGIQPISGDILDPPSLLQLPAAATVLYAVGLDRTAGRSMHEVYVTGLGHVLDTLPACERFIYVSSTSVYGQTDGGWVDESSPTEPTEPSGRIVLEAEQLLRSRRPDAIILRFAGIVGPGRFRKQILSGEPISGDPERWLNLIHVEDGADAVVAAESRGEPGQTYNICDDEPLTRRAFYQRLAESVGAPPPTFDPQPEPGAPHRRIRNTKAKASLGWQLCRRNSDGWTATP
jgi:nucleoside-diphosphate-sugar epimerase